MIAVDVSAPLSPALKALFAAGDEGVPTRNPLVGMYRDDPRHTATFGEGRATA